MADFSSSEIARLQSEARALLGVAETLWRAGEPARWEEALAACDQAMSGLPREEPSADFAALNRDPFFAVRAAAWLMRGRVLVARETPETVVEGLRCFDQAILRMQARAGGDGPDTERAITWMNRGSALLRLGEPAAWREAVRSYEEAIAGLETAPAEFQNALGAAWMNKGAGLLRIGGDGELAEASNAFERAVAVLEPLADSQPEARRNLAAAWANRGQALGLRGDPAGATDACRRAVEAFRPLVETREPSSGRELAALLLTLGQAAGVAGETDRATDAMREALGLIAPTETTDLPAAQLGLRARHALGVILGGLLAKDRAPGGARSARLAEAGDLAEDGLAVARSWGEAGAPLAGDGARLFELGAWLYRTQQPQFLAEFLLEHLDDDPARARIASAAVGLARQAVVQRGFADGGEGGLERTTRLLAGLNDVEARLRASAIA